MTEDQREIAKIWIGALAVVGVVAFYESGPGAQGWLAAFGAIMAAAMVSMAYTVWTVARIWRRQLNRPRAPQLAWELRNAAYEAWMRHSNVTDMLWRNGPEREQYLDAFVDAKHRFFRILQRAELSFAEHSEELQSIRHDISQESTALLFKADHYPGDLDPDPQTETNAEEESAKLEKERREIMRALSQQFDRVIEIANTFLPLED